MMIERNWSSVSKKEATSTLRGNMCINLPGLPPRSALMAHNKIAFE